MSWGDKFNLWFLGYGGLVYCVGSLIESLIHLFGNDFNSKETIKALASVAIGALFMLKYWALR